MTCCFAVVANKSWYEGYIPFYIFFARRACPEAHVLVYFMGSLEEETRDAIRAIAGDPSGYTLIENYKPAYGQSPIAAKMARFTIDDSRIRSFDLAYIGDLDIMVCLEQETLFSQHRRHADAMGLPMSNMVRDGSRRLTGLNFFQTGPYFDAVSAQISAWDQEIARLESLGQISKVWDKGCEDEEGLYRMIAAARPDWIAPMEKTRFRPHHGTHMGNFRNCNAKAFQRFLQGRFESWHHPYHRDTFDVLPSILCHPEIAMLLARFPKLTATFRNFIRLRMDYEAGRLTTKPAGQT